MARETRHNIAMNRSRNKRVENGGSTPGPVIAVVMSLRGTAFADSIESTSDPLERRIAAELWRWSSLSETDRSAIRSPQSQLAGAIEFYLCGAFHHENSAPSRFWWCDGADELSIAEISPTAFLIVGAAYWAKSGHGSSPFYLAPFELEFYFHCAGDLDAERAIIRFGSMDELREIECVRYDVNPTGIVQNRPTRNADWAFAIELT